MTSEVVIRRMAPADIPGAVALQRACFPAPFPEELLWNSDHLCRHLELYPEGQFVAVLNGMVVASASATKISEDNWRAHRSWDETVGGPFLETFDPLGTTLYGLDISVHPANRGSGLGRKLYEARLNLVKGEELTRYGTACRLPGFREYEESHPGATPAEYAEAVARGEAVDRTLTPLLRYGLTYLETLSDYMEDHESANSAALLEWKP